MPDRTFAFILDAPQGEPPARVQIAKLGDDFNDPRYGDFAITADEVAEWSKNLSKLPGGIALIDEDHLADKVGPARRTEASGWITGVQLEDGVPMAAVEWTPKGKSAIEDRRYLFFSPVFGPYTDERGVTHSNVLTGGALTNKPFLNMPTISLSQAPFDQRMLDALGPQASTETEPVAPARPSDSPRQMSTQATDLTKLRTALGLADDADETKILEKVEALSAAPAKTLEQMAEEQGKVILEKDTVDRLNKTATQVVALESTVAELQDERARDRFEAAWDRAVQAGRAAPATKDRMVKLYAADAEETLKLLEESPVVVNTGARRGAGGDGAAGPAPDNVFEPSYELEQQVRTHMTEHRVDYLKALEAVTGVTV